MFRRAENLWQNSFDNIVEILTLYTWGVCCGTHYTRSVKGIIRFIEAENRKIYNPVGVNLRNPVKTAFLFLEIEIY